MVSDTLGNADGPITLTSGSLTISVPSGALMEGVKKTRLSDNKRMAVGFAGSTGAHGYIEVFTEASTPEDAMRCVRSHIESHFDFSLRDALIEGKARMEHSLILSFFDLEKEAFFSSMYGFTNFSSWSDLSVRRANPAPILLHVGSGSSHFEKAVGLEAINSFVAEVERGMALEDQLKWIDDAYEKVSLVAPGCGAQFEAAIATRDQPEFMFIREASGMTLKPHSVSADK